MTTLEIIRKFIVENLLVEQNGSIIADDPLTESGLIDSLGMLRLIMFLEQQFGIQVGDGDVGVENFGTLSRVAEFVERKQSDRGALSSPVK